MQYNLSQLAKQANPRSRKDGIMLPEIAAPSTMATNLYRGAYKPVIDVWVEAKVNIVAAYERALGQMVADSPEDVQAVIEEAQSSVMQLLPLLSRRVREWAYGVGEYVDNKWRGAVLPACKVDIGTLMGPDATRATIETYLQWNTDLISDVSTQTKQRVANAVFTGLRQRTPARDVAKAISDATGMGRDRALRISSDQLSKLVGALAEERQREAGIDIVEWMHSKKKHPRLDHQARNGRRYYLETKKAVDGSEVVPASDWVQQPPYCGCRTRAWVDLG